ncbi:hypothetical protein HY990_06880 [Candidatus Micrarchaeota archaeon]|nr:hypothetical protein [Candidatus Micrarchaeota archaeon]
MAQRVRPPTLTSLPPFSVPGSGVAPRPADPMAQSERSAKALLTRADLSISTDPVSSRSDYVAAGSLLSEAAMFRFRSGEFNRAVIDYTDSSRAYLKAYECCSNPADLRSAADELFRASNVREYEASRQSDSSKRSAALVAAADLLGRSSMVYEDASLPLLSRKVLVRRAWNLLRAFVQDSESGNRDLAVKHFNNARQSLFDSDALSPPDASTDYRARLDAVCSDWSSLVSFIESLNPAAKTST